MRLFSVIFLLSLGLIRVAAGASPLLSRAAEPWLAEGNRWAFTVQVKQFDGAEVKEVRVERFDPSKPGAARWELLSVDGAAPTEERRAAWQKAKMKKHRPMPASMAEYFDFDNASVVKIMPQAISYLLPLRSRHAVLLPMERVDLTVTVNRTTHVIEEVKAGIDEPFHTALGLARVIEVNFDLKLTPIGPSRTVTGPGNAHPAGPAHMVIAKLGERTEYDWSDFQRVTPAADSEPADKPEN